MIDNFNVSVGTCSPDAPRAKSGETHPAYVRIDYTNHRGERRARLILPMALTFRSSEWHAGKQWILVAMDLETGSQREFAMANVHSWQSST